MLKQRIVVSIFALLSVLVIVSLTILFVLGYRLDLENRRLEQGALLQFDSIPNNADIWIDGNHSGATTAAKRMVMAGEHEFIISKNKYEDWKRTLNVAAGTLTWLDYARLVPRDRPAVEIFNYETLVSAKASPDKKTYFIQESKSDPVFSVVDLTSEEVRATDLVLPEDLYDTSSDKASEFRVKQWDHGGRYIIVTHHIDKKVEWLVVDTQNVRASRNVTRLLGVQPKDLQFVGTDGRTLYSLNTDSTLRKLDLGAQTISRPLVSNVSSFTIDHDTKIVGYVGVDPKDSERRVVGVYRDGDSSGFILRGTTTDSSLGITTTLHHGNDYFAVAEGGTVTILKGAYPRTEQDVDQLSSFATISLDGHVKNLSFGKGGRFFVAQTDTAFVGYEMEHKRSRIVNFSQKNTELRWLDEAYLWSDIGGELKMRDFDGSNSYSIMSLAEGFDVTLSQNGRFMYSIGQLDDGDGYTLQRVRMILN